MSKKTKTTALENELDQILASVDEHLAKSLPPMKKEDEPASEEAPAEAAPEAPANEQPEAPAAEAPAPEADAAPAPEAAAPAAEEAPLQDESADQPLSDEELDQIYGSMAPEELQRHYMAMRAHLEAHAGAGEGAQEQAPPAAPAPEAPAPEQEQPLAASEDCDDMEKSEAAAILKALRAENEELKKGLDVAVKAVQTILQPERKSIAGVEFITKNEGEKAPANGQLRSDLTKSEIDAKYREIGIANFSKSERETVNGYFLNDQGKDKVLDILTSKRGK